ncbi:MAG TPA: hypothetical protein VGL47_32180 [Amycolatopsis sp.]|uniref:hypothetical protein n=1 Tax=Amycolatopsis sp. TaxID=37632 RepID=UPI002F42C7A6
MNTGAVLAGFGLLIALFGVPLTWANLRRVRSESTEGSFRRVNEHVRLRQSQLRSLAGSDTRPEWRADEIPMLTKPGWVLPEPILLESVEVEYEADYENEQFTEARSRAQKMMPRKRGGQRYAGYSEALVDLAGMTQLYNGWIYRPTGVVAQGGGLRLSFTGGYYYDHLDTSEVLAYEAAINDLAGRAAVDGAYRRYLGDPFDLRRRGTSLGVVVLTIRASDEGCGFYMHRRDERRVAAAPDTIHVIPAGEFSPSDIELGSRERDFDIWHTVMREYAEEFLDVEESYGRGGRPPDYDNEWPYRELIAAKKEGVLRLYVLGAGLDPLTWKPELLLICVFDHTAFDSLFAKIVPKGTEGTIVVGPRGYGIPFDAGSVDRYARDPSTRNAAQACLLLAWRHRAVLGLASGA